jgi:two-component system sensor histidine kinase YesM
MLFVLTSTIPIILLSLFTFYNTLSTLRKNTETLTNINLKQIDDNMQIWLESYQDLLYQIYTNDDVVEWVDKLNQNQDVAVTTNQMRRYLNSLLNTKQEIRSITIITDSGMVITYDQLTPATYDNSWIKNFSLSQEELYQQVSADNELHIFPTEFGTRFANEDYYLFHLSHRIIDYRKLEKQTGIVIVSMDQELLQNILSTGTETGENDTNVNFLVDETGRVISCKNKEYIGTELFQGTMTDEDRLQVYRTCVARSEKYDAHNTSVYMYSDKQLGWDIVNLTDQSSYVQRLRERAYFIGAICVLLVVVTMLIVWKISGQLVDSVNTVVETMQSAEEGQWSVRVPLKKKMPVEIETIAQQFNNTLEKLNDAVQKEKEAGEKQRQAEIKALEAQINPHFLYNTLDTINWMAIDKDEFDISNAINSLAEILRYAIANSNETVTIREEVEWLKKYIYLQQFRLKNKFIRHIHVTPEITEYKIHKLILQPFVENAIIHGFERGQEQHVLEVDMEKDKDGIKIRIMDNGKGIDAKTLEQLNNWEEMEITSQDKRHIGMANAFTRLHMYYKGQEKIKIESKMGQGTEVFLWLPVKESE